MKVPENEDEETGEARAQEPMSSRKGESGGIGRGGLHFTAASRRPRKYYI